MHRKAELLVKSVGNMIESKMHAFDYMFAVLFMRKVARKMKKIGMIQLPEEQSIFGALKLLEATVQKSKDSP